MKEFIQKYQKAIIGTGAVSVLLICYFQQKELTKLRKINTIISAPPTKADSLQAVLDNLQSELFIEKTINGRYELSLENLKQTNPKAAANFMYFMEHETE